MSFVIALFWLCTLYLSALPTPWLVADNWIFQYIPEFIIVASNIIARVIFQSQTLTRWTDFILFIHLFLFFAQTL